MENYSALVPDCILSAEFANVRMNRTKVSQEQVGKSLIKRIFDAWEKPCAIKGVFFPKTNQSPKHGVKNENRIICFMTGIIGSWHYHYI